MRFLNKSLLNSDAIIIYFCFIVFFLRLYACQYIVPDFNGMDYYGYIELAKNIFHHLDFTVRWELDRPVLYPPFFSILIYLLSFLIKDPVAAIQYINIFCSSFCMVPLFLLVRNMLNVYFAVLAVIFTTSYFGVQPCHMLTMDFFYSFLIMVICWLIWDTLTHRSLQAGRYVLAGALISVAYLTKYSGILFGYASMASILFYFAQYPRRIKTGFKMSAFLLLGALPLMMAYHLLLDVHGRKDTPSIAAYAFFDGNYMYEKGWRYREEKMSELNKEGTEFAYLSVLRADNESNFFLRNPLYVAGKYAWGLNKMTQYMTFSVLPGGSIAKSKFYGIGQDGKIYNLLTDGGWTGILREISSQEVVVNPDYYLTRGAVQKAVGGYYLDDVWNVLQRSLHSRMAINIIFQALFVILFIISGIYYQWPFNLLHILIFTIGVVLIPLYFISERYLMPFMPLYFILWLFILNAGHAFIKKEIKDKVFLKNAVYVIFVCLVFIYVNKSCKEVEQRCRYFRAAVEVNEEWLQTAAWIKKDLIGLPRRAKIMTCSDNYLSYLTDSDYIRLPYVILNWDKVKDFAVLNKVDYIMVEKYNLYYFLRFSEDEFKEPMTPLALISAIKAGSPRIAMHTFPSALSPIEGLNKLLEYPDLYQVMPVWPACFRDFIRHLKEGERLNALDVMQLNRLLIETNYPREAPHKLELDINADAKPGHIKAIHVTRGGFNTFWVFKI